MTQGPERSAWCVELNSQGNSYEGHSTRLAQECTGMQDYEVVGLQ
jgi:hypothetical protein